MTKEQKNHPRYKDWVRECTIGDICRYGISGSLKDSDIFDHEYIRLSLEVMITAYHNADQIYKEIEAEAPSDQRLEDGKRMTIRDAAGIAALQSLIVNDKEIDYGMAAEQAVAYADALVLELSYQPEEIEKGTSDSDSGGA